MQEEGRMMERRRGLEKGAGGGRGSEVAGEFSGGDAVGDDQLHLTDQGRDVRGDDVGHLPDDVMMHAKQLGIMEDLAALEGAERVEPFAEAPSRGG